MIEAFLLLFINLVILTIFVFTGKPIFLLAVYSIDSIIFLLSIFSGEILILIFLLISLIIEKTPIVQNTLRARQKEIKNNVLEKEKLHTEEK